MVLFSVGVLLFLATLGLNYFVFTNYKKKSSEIESRLAAERGNRNQVIKRFKYHMSLYSYLDGVAFYRHMYSMPDQKRVVESALLNEAIHQIENQKDVEPLIYLLFSLSKLPIEIPPDQNEPIINLVEKKYTELTTAEPKSHPLNQCEKKEIFEEIQNYLISVLEGNESLKKYIENDVAINKGIAASITTIKILAHANRTSSQAS